MPLHGEAVGEGHAATGGVAGLGPVSELEQYRFQQSDFDHFTRDAFDLDPIAHANAVLAHEREPPEKGHDEILHGHGEASGDEADHG